MKTIELTFSDESIDEIQQYLKDSFQFPDYYGMNLDALYDCLTDIEEEMIICIHLDKENSYHKRILQVMQDATKENPNLTVIEIKEEIDIIEILKQEMIQYEKGVPHRIHHFLKVHSFARTIGQKENLDKETLFLLETACLVHDIGIRPSLEKYGNSLGPNQEKEGIEPARNMLIKLNYDSQIIDRVCFLVGHHHTYFLDAGIDYQILLEADFLVNSFEDDMDKEKIIKFRDSVFKTKTGISILNTMYGLE